MFNLYLTEYWDRVERLGRALKKVQQRQHPQLYWERAEELRQWMQVRQYPPMYWDAMKRAQELQRYMDQTWLKERHFALKKPITVQVNIGTIVVRKKKME